MDPPEILVDLTSYLVADLKFFRTDLPEFWWVRPKEFLETQKNSDEFVRNSDGFVRRNPREGWTLNIHCKGGTLQMVGICEFIGFLQYNVTTFALLADGWDSWYCSLLVDAFDQKPYDFYLTQLLWPKTALFALKPRDKYKVLDFNWNRPHFGHNLHGIVGFSAKSRYIF